MLNIICEYRPRQQLWAKDNSESTALGMFR